MTGKLKPRILPSLSASTSSSLLFEPTSYNQAAKNPQLLKAMNEEFDALIQNNTWSLVPPPSNANIIGSKWVFRIKYSSDDSVDHYKACLVAQGYSQQPGVDFSETFAPVVKLSTV
ncbi:uncharacterized mitochondrial protein AtMg00820-like [Nicotiana sylvestris]|uniref:uncharacterized mitochondrial protein AtMg00820-like n=1 Tax=Nicotiana sylvestris TaxID=4096 RepID=UPI00388C4795